MAILKLECTERSNSEMTEKLTKSKPDFASDENVIVCENLFKSYQNHKALDDISLQVKKGELFGLIGPDGAGKTTLFRILTTLILAESGKASVLGCDVVKEYKQIRNLIGYMPGRFSLYQDLSVEENIHFFATVFNTNLQENYHLVKDIYGQIEPFKNRRAGKLSGGMKQKLALSCALIHKPEVLFLDEPTTGVDPVSRKEFWEMLKRLKNQGITILVSTPYMDEAILCDRIALMQEGKFLKIDTPEQIIRDYEDNVWAVKSDKMPQLLKELRKYRGVHSVYSFGDFHHLSMKEELDVEKLTVFLKEKGYGKIQVERILPGIEDCFMAFSKK